MVGTIALVRACAGAVRRRGYAPGTAPLAARPVARPDLVWARARDRFHALRAEYAAYECNTMEVLRIPALADVTVPSTARFVDAFAEAQALETDAMPPDPHRSRVRHRRRPGRAGLAGGPRRGRADPAVRAVRRPNGAPWSA